MLGLVLALAILGLVLYLIETYVYLANMFGVMDLPVPRGK